MRALLLKLTCGPPGRGAVAPSAAARWPIRPAPLTVDAGIRQHDIQVEILVTRPAATRLSANATFEEAAPVL